MYPFVTLSCPRYHMLLGSGFLLLSNVLIIYKNQW